MKTVGEIRVAIRKREHTLAERYGLKVLQNMRDAREFVRGMTMEELRPIKRPSMLS